MSIHPVNPNKTNPAAAVSAFTDDVLARNDATALADLIRCKKISASEVASATIARAEAVNPILNGIASRDFERLIEQAKAFDELPKLLESYKPFAGVPTLIKDNADVAGLPTMFGSQAVAMNTSATSSVFTQLMFDLGFCSLGKSTMSEFGFNATNEPVVGPPTRNPWNPAFSSGASSSGAAAMVASGVVTVAHGNDGGGSIRIPAASCGLVGLKPSRGRTPNNPRTAMLPINIVSEGIVTSSLRDTANFYLAAERLKKHPTLQPIGPTIELNSRRLRIGLIFESDNGAQTDEPTLEAVKHIAKALETLGHRVNPAPLPIDKKFGDDFALYWMFLCFSITNFGTKLIASDFDASKLENLCRGLSKKFTRNFYRFPGVLWRLRRCGIVFEQSMRQNQVDVYLSPVTTTTTPQIGFLDTHLSADDLFERLRTYAGFTPVANAVGVPAISLPTSKTDFNIPIGVHLSSAMGDERTLLQLALELETNGHLLPNLMA